MGFGPLVLGALALCLAVTARCAEPLSGTLKKIKETSSITLGYRESSIPFSYLDDQQRPIGYALEISYRVIDQIKKELNLPSLEVKLNPVTSATRIPLMANGTIDLECGSTTNNAERRRQVDFTNAHFLTASKFVAKKATGVATMTHEMGFARRVADRIVFMDRGQIVEEAPSREFFAAPRSKRAQEFLSKILAH